jgi:hypothetical protein
MRTERPRFVYYVLPAAAVFAVALGAVWGWVGVQALIAGAGWFGVLLVVFGIAGVALGLALWRAWRMIAHRARGAS